MEELRRSVGLRGYGQKDPLSEYKNEAFRAFDEMMGAMRSDVCSGIFRSSTNVAAFENMLATLSDVAKTTGPESTGGGSFLGSTPVAAPQGALGGDAPELPSESEMPRVPVPVVRDAPKVGRNDPCPCGSGKKYKKCCGVGISS